MNENKIINSKLNKLHEWEFECLGDLDNKAKENSCWKQGRISGSKMTRLFKEPDVVLKEDLGLVEKYDLQADPVIAEKLRRGTSAEEFIRQEAEKEWGIKINVDKNTYNLKNTLFYANIDGYDDDVIYEIKNTETDNMDDIVERYKWQGVYYCWFFGKPAVEFIALIKGYKLRRRRYEPTAEEYSELKKRMSDFIIAFNTDDADFFKPNNLSEGENMIYEISDELTEQKLSQLIKIQDKQKELELCEKELKGFFAEVLNKSGTAFISQKTGCKVSLIKSKRSGSIDKDKLISLYPTLEIPTKPDYVSTIVKITKPKQTEKE